MSLPECSTTALSTKARVILEALQQVALAVAESRGYHHNTTQVHFFLPGQLLARVCNMARSTLYLKLKELKAVGLVDSRGHYATFRGVTRFDGTVFAIRVRGDASEPVRVPYDALKKSYRCLSADVEAGRTVKAYLESDNLKEPGKGEIDIQLLLSWAVNNLPTNNHVTKTVRSARPDLESILDLPHVAREDRPQAVVTAAQALSTALGDAKSIMFYRWLCWRLIKHLEATGESHFYALYLTAQRTQTDVKEGWARKGGAVFANRVKTIHEGFLMCCQ